MAPELAAPPPNSRIQAHDAATWTIAEDTLPDGRRIVTSWSPVRFSPTFGLGGTPLHFQTVIVEVDASLGASWEYEFESEAKVGHARVFADLRKGGVS